MASMDIPVETLLEALQNNKTISDEIKPKVTKMLLAVKQMEQYVMTLTQECRGDISDSDLTIKEQKSTFMTHLYKGVLTSIETGMLPSKEQIWNEQQTALRETQKTYPTATMDSVLGRRVLKIFSSRTKHLIEALKEAAPEKDILITKLAPKQFR